MLHDAANSSSEDLPQTAQHAIVCTIQRFSSEDGPGIRTTVFFKGCPMRCPWCHNPETVRFQPEVVWNADRCLRDRGCIAQCERKALAVEEGSSRVKIDREHCETCGRCVAFCPSAALEMFGKAYFAEELFETVMRDSTFHDSSGGGVTLSGGEPLAQPEVAIPLMKMLRGAGVHTALDTCGAADPDALKEALAHCDLVLFDVKTVSPDHHREWTGIDWERVVGSARIVRDSGVPVWVRTPVIPGYTANEEEISAIAGFVAEMFPQCERHDLLAFSNLCVSKYEQLSRAFPLSGVPLLTQECMELLCGVAREAGSLKACWSGPTAVKAEAK
ncbi:MAG: glycyl-radical enzyme activating protein [Candidatus Hydrogenedentes bacterium]|nr:glycyl-radical enzyme activating protein [Candidatus Hydrogenedentota bacterium]